MHRRFSPLGRRRAAAPVRALAAAVLAGLLVLALAPSAAAGWWDGLDKGRSVTLGDVIAQPGAYDDDLLTFFCVFHRRDDVFNPLQTPFHPSRYSNVSVWADGAQVWEQDTYAHDFPFLYIERRHPRHDALLATPAFTRLEVTARVKGRLRAFPCLEILAFRETSQRLGKAVVDSVVYGDRYAEMDDGELAYESYRRALQPDLPQRYRLLIERRIAERLLALGRVDEARALLGAEALAEAQPVEPASPAPAAAPPALPSTAQGGPDGVPVSVEAPSPSGVPTPAVPFVGAGSPDAPCPPPPVGRGSPDAPAATSPPPVITDDLPGRPVEGPLTRDLPGLPAGASDAAPPEGAPPEAVPPAPPPPPERTAPRSGADRIPGAPPRRTPRLTGVR